MAPCGSTTDGGFHVHKPPSHPPVRKQMSVDRIESPSSPPKSKKNFFDGFRVRPRVRPECRAQSDPVPETEGQILSPTREYHEDSSHWPDVNKGVSIKLFLIKI